MGAGLRVNHHGRQLVPADQSMLPEIKCVRVSVKKHEGPVGA